MAQRTRVSQGASDLRGLCIACTVFVLAMQIAVVVMFWFEPSDPPQGGLVQGLWALSHKPLFVPVVGLLAFGPPATWLAWSVRGMHRRWLMGGWAVFGIVIAFAFAERFITMAQILLNHANR